MCDVPAVVGTSGTLVAQRLTIGGVITIPNVVLGAMDHSCEIELSVTFACGTSIQSSFSFQFNALGPDESFCLH